MWTTLFPDVACESVDRAVQELRELGNSGNTLVVHTACSSFGRPAETYCSQDHEHVVMELAYDFLKDVHGLCLLDPHRMLLEAILDDEGRANLLAAKQPLDYPGMNQSVEEIVIIPTRLTGIRIRARRWAEASNFNGGYDVGGTQFTILVN